MPACWPRNSSARPPSMPRTMPSTAPGAPGPGPRAEPDQRQPGHLRHAGSEHPAVVTAVIADAGRWSAPASRAAHCPTGGKGSGHRRSGKPAGRTPAARKSDAVSLWAEPKITVCAANCANWRRPPTRRPAPTPPESACSNPPPELRLGMTARVACSEGQPPTTCWYR
jgi:hypothetical protein